MDLKKISFSKEISLCDAYDVIVVGAGPAGCAAAAASAREGTRTLLVEASGMLGGMGTGGLVPSWSPFWDKEKIIYRGLAEKVLNETKKYSDHIMPQDLVWVPIDSEVLKRVYDKLVTENGADILFNTQLCSVLTDENKKVTSVILSNKKGLTAYSAKVFIDCTGDADLAAFAGAEFECGADDGSFMPATLCFVIGNVDEYAYRFDNQSGLNYGTMQGTNPKSAIHKIVADPKYPLVTDSHLCHQIIGPRTIGFNAGHLFNVDSTDPQSVSKAMIEGRELIYQLHQGLKEYFPTAFGSSILVETAPMMGIRESRRIVGDYKMTVEDYLQKRSFPDEISRNSYYIDLHLTIKEIEETKKKGISLDEINRRYKPGESHGIPYRSLIPKGIPNIIVAGRSISCDRQIQGSIRVMPNCLCTGEAAGIAAAMALNKNNNVHDIDVNKLRERLKSYGAYFL